MNSSTISFKSSVIHYSYGGHGIQPLICFHGYGETEYSFHFLEKHLATTYTIIAIDLPYHGKTQWNEGLNFEKSDLGLVTETLLEKQGFVNVPFALLAYSMGGRLALTLLQEIPHRINRVVLLAPDGLKINFWYWLSTQTRIGNQLFAATIHNPAWFLWILKLLHGSGLLNQSVYKFVRYFLHDKKMRKQLYLRWTCFRNLTPDLVKSKKIITENKISVHLLYGKYDRIIRSERGEKFRKGIETYCSIELLNSGHQLLHEKNVIAISNHLTG